mmetsp:Transcript_34797/g.51719  ORF Transcript_34797/g.51719 Transcript_34797/m.51719 type:complete len:202 (+) Transcript_34797:233-838(+)
MAASRCLRSRDVLGGDARGGSNLNGLDMASFGSSIPSMLPPSSFENIEFDTVGNESFMLTSTPGSKPNGSNTSFVGSVGEVTWLLLMSSPEKKGSVAKAKGSSSSVNCKLLFPDLSPFLEGETSPSTNDTFFVDRVGEMFFCKAGRNDCSFDDSSGIVGGELWPELTPDTIGLMCHSAESAVSAVSNKSCEYCSSMVWSMV